MVLNVKYFFYIILFNYYVDRLAIKIDSDYKWFVRLNSIVNIQVKHLVF